MRGLYLVRIILDRRECHERRLKKVCKTYLTCQGAAEAPVAKRSHEAHHARLPDSSKQRQSFWGKNLVGADVLPANITRISVFTRLSISSGTSLSVLTSSTDA